VPPKRLPRRTSNSIEGYDSIVSELVDLVESARRVSARAVNSIMTATYWEIGRRIVESEQRGKRRAEYGEALLKNLAFDLTAKFDRGFSLANLKNIPEVLPHMACRGLNWPDSVWPFPAPGAGWPFSSPLVSLRAPIRGFQRRSAQIL
jgi:hypothetical protein